LARLRPAMGDAHTYDCVVVGAGPAGLTAAIYLARFRRDFLVIDAGHSRAAWIPTSHNHPGFPKGVRGKTLLARMRRQAETYGAAFRPGHVSDLKPLKSGFRLATADGTLRAKTVILATGVVDNEPDVPGAQEAVLRGLLRVCPICDGYEVIGQSVGVISADDHGAREARFLTTYSKDVCLIHIGAPDDLSAEARKRLKADGVGVIETPMESVVLDHRRITAICFGPGEPRRFDAVYSALGVTPRASLAVDAGARLDKTGRLFVGEHQETSVPGLYAAGDVVRGLNQISTAAGEGAIAATDIHNCLRETR
jgi:thioredoxin reductase (NADPH)